MGDIESKPEPPDDSGNSANVPQRCPSQIEPPDDSGNSANVPQRCPRPPDRPTVNPGNLLQNLKECQRIVLAAASSIVTDLSSDKSESAKTPSPNPVADSELVHKLIECERTLLDAANNIVNVLSAARSTTKSDLKSLTLENEDSGNASDGDATEQREHEDQIQQEPADLACPAGDTSEDDVDMERDKQPVSVESNMHHEHFNAVDLRVKKSETGPAISDIDENESNDSLLDNLSLSGGIDSDDDILNEEIENMVTNSKDHEDPNTSSAASESIAEKLVSNNIMNEPTGINDEETARNLEEAETASEASSSTPESDDTEIYFEDDFEEMHNDSCNEKQTIEDVQSDDNDNIAMPLSLNKEISNTDIEHNSEAMKREREGEHAYPSPEMKRCKIDEVNDDESEELDASGFDGCESFAGRFSRTMFGTKEHSAATPGSLFEPDKNKGDKKKRKMFRRKKKKVLDEDSLVLNTIKAINDEERRTQRIAERREEYGIKDLEDKDMSVRLDTLVLDYDPLTKTPVITVDPGLLAMLMPHQVNGVMFMWEACFESVKQIKVNQLGTGCILAHCMGLGKTLQVVTLVHTLFWHAALTGVKRVLVVCPKSTALNWAAEFHRWLYRTQRKCEIIIYEITTLNDLQSRIDVLAQWVQQGGVCVIGYAMFRQLVMPANRKNSKDPQEPHVLDPSVTAALLDPGADLVVCDEGHGLKNEDTAVAQALAQVRTRRRVMLTGTPLQNNLKEYYQMVNFVKPKLLGNKDEFYNRFEVPIYNGQFQDSKPAEIDDMKRQAHVLHKLLTPTIQRKHYTMVPGTRNSFLPPKTEFGLYIKLTPLQKTLYQCFLDGFGANARKYKLFRDYQTFLRIYNHPLALKFHKESEEKRMKKEKKKNKDDETKTLLPEIALDWFEADVEGTNLENIELSHKLSLLFDIMRHCEQNGEKLLVFSQSLYVLRVIEFFLEAENNERSSSDGNFCRWKKDVNYFRLDGTSKAEARDQSCKMFNSDEPNARLFLISTRAGGLGINLTAATRVVLFDVSWNPSHDVQSIFRVYRIGQRKPCFIYRFIASGTIEHKIYNRQVTKLSVAKRVVDENQVARHFSVEELTKLYELEPPSAPRTPRTCKSDKLLDALLKQNNCIVDYSEHDSLLADMAEERLSEEERVQAWKKYEQDRERAANPDTVDPVHQHLHELESEPCARKLEAVPNNTKIDQDTSISGKKDLLPPNPPTEDSTAQSNPKDKDNSINQGASTSGASNEAGKIEKKQKNILTPTNPTTGESTTKTNPKGKDNSINQGASTSGTSNAAATIKKTKKKGPLPANLPEGVSKVHAVPKVEYNRTKQNASTSGTSETPAKLKKEQKEEILQLLTKIMPNLGKTKKQTLALKVLKAGPQGRRILDHILALQLRRRNYDFTPNIKDKYLENLSYLMEEQQDFRDNMAKLLKCSEMIHVAVEYENQQRIWLNKKYNDLVGIWGVGPLRGSQAFQKRHWASNTGRGAGASNTGRSAGVSNRGRLAGASNRGRGAGPSNRGRCTGTSNTGRSAGVSNRGRRAGASNRGRGAKRARRRAI